MVAERVGSAGQAGDAIDGDPVLIARSPVTIERRLLRRARGEMPRGGPAPSRPGRDRAGPAHPVRKHVCVRSGAHPCQASGSGRVVGETSRQRLQGRQPTGIGYRLLRRDCRGVTRSALWSRAPSHPTDVNRRGRSVLASDAQRPSGEEAKMRAAAVGDQLHSLRGDRSTCFSVRSTVDCAGPSAAARCFEAGCSATRQGRRGSPRCAEGQSTRSLIEQVKGVARRLEQKRRSLDSSFAGMRRL